MADLNSSKKNKISLSDYDYKSDLENRLIMSHFTTSDLLVLEEILYSSLKLSVKKLSKDLEIEEEKLSLILEKFSKIGLLTLRGDEILIDKEMRKYYESQILKFEEGFIPGMEFLQSLLRKVPIQVLPVWYSIPRGSNNIFDSLIEKYLLTPQIFERYVQDNLQGDPTLAHIVQTVYGTPDYKVFGSDLMSLCNLSREKFEEHLLYLEFNFLCCLGYEKIGDEWKEIVTPFHEWREYLRFLRDTEVGPLPENAKIEKTEPLNKFSEEEIPSHLRSDKNIREIEKSLGRVAKKGWVYFDEFLKGVIAPLGERSTVQLKKIGKTWKYSLPEYGEAEKALIKEMVFSTLPKAGMVVTGRHDGRDCFRVTST